MDGRGKGCKMPWHVVVWSVGLALKLVEDSMAGLSGSGNLVEVTQALCRGSVGLWFHRGTISNFTAQRAFW